MKCEASKLSAQSTQPRAAASSQVPLPEARRVASSRSTALMSKRSARRAQPLGELADQLVVGAALLVALEHAGPTVRWVWPRP